MLRTFRGLACRVASLARWTCPRPSAVESPVDLWLQICSKGHLADARARRYRRGHECRPVARRIGGGYPGVLATAPRGRRLRRARRGGGARGARAARAGEAVARPLIA